MNERLSLQDLIDLLAKKQGITKKDAEVFLRELISIISENIENNEPVKIKDLGVFKLVKVNSRKSVDVNTGEAIEIPAHYKLSFIPDKSLKDVINRPFAHFESIVLEDGVSFENIESGDDIDETEEVNTVEEESIPEKVTLVEDTVSADEEVQIDIEEVQPDVVGEEHIEESEDAGIAEVVEEDPEDEPVVSIEEVLENDDSVLVDDSVVDIDTATPEEDVVLVEESEPDIQDQEEDNEPEKTHIEESEDSGIVEVVEEEPEDESVVSIEEALENDDEVLTDDEVVDIDAATPEEDVVSVEESEPDVQDQEGNEPEETHIEEEPDIIEDTTATTDDEQATDTKPFPETISYIKAELDIFEKRKEKQRRRKFITLGFFVFLILAGFIIGAFYFQEIAKYITEGPEDKGKKTVIVFEKTDPNNDSVAVLGDTIITDENSPAPSIEDTPEAIEDTKPKTEQQAPTQTQQPTAASATTTVKTGDTLRNISMAYYGHKSFWVYIYQENKNVIPNFNNVPIGTKLAIPSRSKYGIDATNPASVEKAKKIEAELFSKM